MKLLCYTPVKKDRFIEDGSDFEWILPQNCKLKETAQERYKAYLGNVVDLDGARSGDTLIYDAENGECVFCSNVRVYDKQGVILVFGDFLKKGQSVAAFVDAPVPAELISGELRDKGYFEEIVNSGGDKFLKPNSQSYSSESVDSRLLLMLDNLLDGKQVVINGDDSTYGEAVKLLKDVLSILPPIVANAISFNCNATKIEAIKDTTISCSKLPKYRLEGLKTKFYRLDVNGDNNFILTHHLPKLLQEAPERRGDLFKATVSESLEKVVSKDRLEKYFEILDEEAKKSRISHYCKIAEMSDNAIDNEAIAALNGFLSNDLGEEDFVKFLWQVNSDLVCERVKGIILKCFEKKVGSIADRERCYNEIRSKTNQNDEDISWLLPSIYNKIETVGDITIWSSAYEKYSETRESERLKGLFNSAFNAFISHKFEGKTAKRIFSDLGGHGAAQGKIEKIQNAIDIFEYEDEAFLDKFKEIKKHVEKAQSRKDVLKKIFGSDGYRVAKIKEAANYERLSRKKYVDVQRLEKDRETRLKERISQKAFKNNLKEGTSLWFLLFFVLTMVLMASLSVAVYYLPFFQWELYYNALNIPQSVSFKTLIVFMPIICGMVLYIAQIPHYRHKQIYQFRAALRMFFTTTFVVAIPYILFTLATVAMWYLG